MKYKRKKRKIKKLVYDKRITNELELSQKKNEFSNQYLNNDLFKLPKVLYDSDWIMAQWTDSPGNLNGIWISSDEYSDKEGMELPVNISYILQKDWNIPKKYLSFIKSIVMVDPISPDLTVYGMTPRLTCWNWKSNYKEIKGDEEVLYQGYEVSPNQYYAYSEDQIDQGNIQESHTSNWYKATIEWTQNDGIERRIVDAWITWITATYDFDHTVYNGEECPNWNYYYFSGGAFDNLTENSLTGQGLWTHSWWEGSLYHGSVIWSPRNESEKNKQQTIEILGDTSTQISCRGSYYEKEGGEWVYKGLQEKIIYHGLPYAPPNSNPGYTVTNFSVERAKNVDDKYLYRLWYSTKRARWFSAYDDYTWTLSNRPISDDYEGGIMPYTKMTYKVNPDPHPIKEYPGWEQKGIKHQISVNNPLAWIKTSQGGHEDSFINSADLSRHDRYGLRIVGNIYCTAPAHYNEGTVVSWVDEEYYHDGLQYSRDEVNRGNDKEVNRFVVEPREAKLRIQLVCTNSVYYEQIRKYMEMQ